MRIQKVGEFQKKLVTLAYRYNKRRIDDDCINFHFNSGQDAYCWFSEKWTFDQMLYSFRPLRLKYWFTDEELKEIKR